MEKVIAFLKENPVQYLATVGRDGKAKCRPFMFAGEMDGKLWFCTNNQKDVYKDMQANPYVEVSVSSPSYAWIRLHGKAVFENNIRQQKTRFLKCSAWKSLMVSSLIFPEIRRMNFKRTRYQR